jgi:hypothetical protein
MSKMPTPLAKPKTVVAARPSRALILTVAARMECDPRTAEKAIIGGPDAVRNHVHRERAAAVLTEMGISPKEPSAA